MKKMKQNKEINPERRGELEERQMTSIIATPTLSPTSASNSTSNPIAIQMTQPIMCQTLNITFDPTTGTPPFDVLIAFENWYTDRVQLPATYAPLDSGLWLLQYPVPSFDNVSGTPLPNLVVSLTDSSGMMSNSSVIQQVSPATQGSICPLMTGHLGFVFYINSAPSECAPFEVTWTGLVTAPLTLYVLPEQHPPIAITFPTLTNGTSLTTNLNLKAGTRFLTILDDFDSSGGVSSLNVVGLSGDSDPNCLQNENNYLTSLPLPTQTIPLMSVTPDYTTTQITRTTSAGRIVTVTATETHAEGHVVPSKNPINLTTILAASIGAAVALSIAALVLYCRRKKSKDKTQTTRWEVGGNNSNLANSSNPIHPRFLGRDRNGNESNENLGNHSDGLGMNNTSNSNDRENRIEMNPSLNPSYSNLIPQSQSPNFSNSNYNVNEISSSNLNPFESHEDEIYNSGFINNSNNNNNNSNRAFNSSQSNPDQRYQSRRNNNQFSSHPLTSNSSSSPPVSPHIHSLKDRFINGNDLTYRSIEGNGSSSTVSRERDLIGRTTSSSHLRQRTNPSNLIETNFDRSNQQQQQPSQQNHLRSRSSNQIDPFSPESFEVPWFEFNNHNQNQNQNHASHSNPLSSTFNQSTYNSTRSNRRDTIRGPVVQRHVDAGILQDDNDDEEDGENNGVGTIIDLPPQYEDVHPNGHSFTNQTQNQNQIQIQNQNQSPRSDLPISEDISRSRISDQTNSQNQTQNQNQPSQRDSELSESNMWFSRGNFDSNQTESTVSDDHDDESEAMVM